MTMVKGLLSLLAGAADTFDVIPGFDPVKDQKGLISQLLSGGQQSAPVSPAFGTANAVQKPSMQSAPGGAIPAMKAPLPKDYTTPLNVLDVLNPFKNTLDIRANDQARYNQAKGQFSAQQAQQAAAAQKTARTSEGREAGLQGRELLDFVTSGEVPSIQTITKGDSYLSGNGIQQAPMPFEAHTDAFGRTQAFNPNTGEIGEGQGGAKPISLASGAQAIDPITNEVLASNTGMTDYQSAQIANKQAEIAASANETDVSGESALRKEFLSQNKGFQEVQRAYDRIVSTDPTNAAGQMSLIFQYMKMMDPGSTVREGEFANAQNTTGIPGQVLNAYNRAARGEYLNPTQVSEFQTQAASLYGAAANDFERSFQQYRSTASQYEYDQDRTVPDLRNPEYMEDQIATITSDEQFDALPSGAIYQGPDGVKRRKP
jgi:hypothetical protein